MGPTLAVPRAANKELPGGQSKRDFDNFKTVFTVNFWLDSRLTWCHGWWWGPLDIYVGL